MDKKGLGIERHRERERGKERERERDKKEREIEWIFSHHQRDGLLLEVEALQESSSKLNEDRIFEMKQRIEDLLMENDSLNAQAQALKREVNSLR